ncbi:MAG: hypothetical protein WBO08_12705 [Mycobacterium sp.]|nr:hypothetical protein [Mycobacterium sp.]
MKTLAAAIFGIAVLVAGCSASSTEPSPTEAAQQFVDLVTGPAGQEVLAAAGFAAP